MWPAQHEMKTNCGSQRIISNTEPNNWWHEKYAPGSAWFSRPNSEIDTCLKLRSVEHGTKSADWEDRWNLILNLFESYQNERNKRPDRVNFVQHKNTCSHRHDADDGVPQNQLRLQHDMIKFMTIGELFSRATSKMYNFYNPSTSCNVGRCRMKHDANAAPCWATCVHVFWTSLIS